MSNLVINAVPTVEPAYLAVILVPIHELYSDDATRLERDEDYINALSNDFKKRLIEKPDEHPVQTALRVVRRGNKLVIVAGNYRYDAALRAGLRDLPCTIISGELDSVEMLIEQAKDNVFHKCYTKLELARTIFQIAEKRGCTHYQAGKLVGITSPSEVSKMLRVLTGYPEDLWPLIGEGDGKVPFSTASILARLHPDEAKIRELTDRVVGGRLNRDAAEDTVAPFLRGRKPKAKPIVLKHGDVEMVIRKPAQEGVRAFLERVVAAIKKLKPGDDVNDLPYLFKNGQ